MEMETGTGSDCIGIDIVHFSKCQRQHITYLVVLLKLYLTSTPSFTLQMLLPCTDGTNCIDKRKGSMDDE